MALKRTTVLLFGMLLGCADGEAEEPRMGTIRALSYNVAGLPEGISSSSPAANTPLISPLLNDYELVLVQEDFAYHEELVADLDHAFRSVPGEDISLVNDGLNRFTDLEFTELRRVPWSGCFGGIDSSDGGSGDCLAKKGFSVAEHALNSEHRIVVYNFHAEAGKTAVDLRLLAADFDELAEDILAHYDGRAILVGGDSNLHRGRSDERAILHRFLEATGFEDVCIYLDCPQEEIDRFMFRSGTKIKLEPFHWATPTERFVDSEGEDLSDHPPLESSFRWRLR